MTLAWLADVLRGDGLVVVEHGDWRNRHRAGDWSPRYGVVHATAAPRSQSDAVQVAVVRDGRADLPGPIANAVVDRLGRWHIVGGGRCNSTLVGTAGPFAGWGNTYALSTEACNDNAGEPWPAAQYESYIRGWAAWCRRLGWTAGQLVGHKEHTPGRKTDPTFSMAKFRADVARVLSGEDQDVTPEELRDADVFPNGYRDAATNPKISLGTFVRNVARHTESAKNDAAEAAKLAGAARTAVDQLAARVDQLAAPAAIDYDQLADLVAGALLRRVVTGAPPAAGTPPE